MPELVVSSLARADMREIGDYISRELRSPDAALRMIRRFQKAMLPLRDFPEMGSPLLTAGKQGAPYRFPEMGSPLLTAGKQGAPYRYLVCGSYLIFYHIGPEAVHIDRVLYGRRDYMALLFGDKLEEE